MSNPRTRFIQFKYQAIVLAIGFFMLFGGLLCVTLIHRFLAGIPLILIGTYLVSSHYGISIDKHNRTFKYYKSTFGIKEGIWESFDAFPDVSLLTINQKQTTYSSTNAHNTSRFIIYRVVLLNKKHTKRYVLKEFRKREKAQKFLERFTSDYELKTAIYSPDFS